MSKRNLLFLILILALSAAVIFYWWKTKSSYSWSKPAADPVSQLVRFKSDGSPDIEYINNKVFASYLEATSSAGATLENTVQTIQKNKAAPLIDAQATDLKATMRFSLADLNIKPDNQVDLKQYGLALAEAFKPYGDVSLEYVPAMALAAMQSQNKDDLEPLTIIKISMIQRAGVLLKTPTPESAKNIHLSTINSLLFLAELIYNMEKVRTEPILALESAKRYTTEYFALVATLNQFNAYFKNRNVAFSETEQVKFDLPLTTASTTP